MHLPVNEKKETFHHFRTLNFAPWDFSLLSVGRATVKKHVAFQEKQEESGWQEGTKRSRLLLSRETDKADCSGESKWYGWQESFQSGFSFISNAYRSGPSNAMHTLTQIPRRMFLQPREFLEEEETKLRFVERSLDVKFSRFVFDIHVFFSLASIRLENFTLQYLEDIFLLN